MYKSPVNGVDTLFAGDFCKLMRRAHGGVKILIDER